MRSSILIASYLLKDIWRRWLETPGAVLARVLVAVILSVLLLLLKGVFAVGEKELEARIDRMGVSTLMVRLPMSQQAIEQGSPGLSSLLEPLAHHGQLLVMGLSYVPAETEFGQPVRVLFYREAMLPQLAELEAVPPEGGILLASRELPPDIPVEVTLMGYPVEAQTFPMPVRMSMLEDSHEMLLLPESAAASLVTRGYQELALFFADEAAQIPAISQSIDLLLRHEGYQNFSLRSAQGWLRELESLRDQRRNWERGGGLFCAAIFVLVFGSIAILEYRQNAYIAALIRSFGLSGAALVGRYAVEALVLTGLSGLLAHGLVRAVHEPLFRAAGSDSVWVSLEQLNPYALEQTWVLTFALLGGALVSVLPIALAVRKPVGKVLG